MIVEEGVVSILGQFSAKYLVNNLFLFKQNEAILHAFVD
jgi:hypothetical protein